MADSFTDFIQNLFPSMGQTQRPMLTGTFTDPAGFRASDAAATYYADPFRKQNAITQASLDAALKQKQADEAAQRVQGMLSGDGGAEMSDQGLNPAVAAFLDAEALTPGARDARMTQLSNFLNPLNTTPINYATLLGLNNAKAMAAQNAITGGKISGLISGLFGLSPSGADAIDAGDLGSLGINDGVASIGGVSLGGVDTSGGFDSAGGGTVGGTGMDASNADAIGGWL